MRFIALKTFEIWVPPCVNDLMESTVPCPHHSLAIPLKLKYYVPYYFQRPCKSTHYKLLLGQLSTHSRECVERANERADEGMNGASK